jgi:hypothetical protein
MFVEGDCPHVLLHGLDVGVVGCLVAERRIA